MEPIRLLLLTGVLLLGPWLFMPRRPRGEIGGAARLLWWLNALYCRVWHRLEVEGGPGLPETGPALLIANHTSGIDPMLLQASCRRRLGFLIAREFYEYWAFHWVSRQAGCIPVRRDGQDLAAARSALRAFEEGRVVPVFPEGKIVPTSGREFAAPKPGIGFLVLHARVPVIPAYISGTPPTNRIWRALVTPSRSRVVFGPPVDLEDVGSTGRVDREMMAEVAERMMDAIRALAPAGVVQGRGKWIPPGSFADGLTPANGPRALSGRCPAPGRA